MKSALKCALPTGQEEACPGTGRVISTPGTSRIPSCSASGPASSYARSVPPVRSRACGLYSRCSVSETTSRPSRHASRTCTVGQTSPSEKTECRWRSAVRTSNPVGPGTTRRCRRSCASPAGINARIADDGPCQPSDHPRILAPQPLWPARVLAGFASRRRRVASPYAARHTSSLRGLEVHGPENPTDSRARPVFGRSDMAGVIDPISSRDHQRPSMPAQQA